MTFHFDCPTEKAKIFTPGLDRSAGSGLVIVVQAFLAEILHVVLLLLARFALLGNAGPEWQTWLRLALNSAWTGVANRTFLGYMFELFSAQSDLIELLFFPFDALSRTILKRFLSDSSEFAEGTIAATVHLPFISLAACTLCQKYAWAGEELLFVSEFTAVFRYTWPGVVASVFTLFRNAHFGPISLRDEVRSDISKSWTEDGLIVTRSIFGYWAYAGLALAVYAVDVLYITRGGGTTYFDGRGEALSYSVFIALSLAIAAAPRGLRASLRGLTVLVDRSSPWGGGKFTGAIQGIRSVIAVEDIAGAREHYDPDSLCAAKLSVHEREGMMGKLRVRVLGLTLGREERKLRHGIYVGRSWTSVYHIPFDGETVDENKLLAIRSWHLVEGQGVLKHPDGINVVERF